MPTFYLVITALMALGLATMGLSAVARDRVPVTWMGRSVTRPRVWGAGVLLAATAIGAIRFLPAEVDIALLMAGIALVGLAQFMGRPVHS
ncbi:hypothetical protein [Streptomyces laurentii]|uniref:hypothetical protein n=1 Tax=Streptomyces laurentii TaxID=39478 RepID=UPI0036944C4C